MNNHTVLTIKAKVTHYLKTISKVAIIISALVIGAVIHDIYLRINHPNSSPQKFEKTKKASETSVAINERGELMIIDRSNGNYQLYQDSLGTMIFDMYASRIYSKIK